MDDNPFLIDNTHAYEIWKKHKLESYSRNISDLTTSIVDPSELSVEERLGLARSLERNNYAIYQTRVEMNKSDLQSFAYQIGLDNIIADSNSDETGISDITVTKNTQQSRYIPFSNHPLNWHTDGYYNTDDLTVQSFILHCVSPASEGGANHILDHEMAYLLLRDENSEFISALMETDAMTIPANRLDDQELRTDVIGSVFSVSKAGRLVMRYTARTRSIFWKQNPILTEARKALAEILNHSEFIVKHTLSKGQGIICNNVLHARTAFTDTSTTKRHIYRARYRHRPSFYD